MEPLKCEIGINIPARTLLAMLLLIYAWSKSTDVKVKVAPGMPHVISIDIIFYLTHIWKL